MLRVQLLMIGAFLSAQTLRLQPSQIHKALSRYSSSQHVSSGHARTANLWLPDSIWNDTFNLNTNQWDEISLITFFYSSAGRLLQDSSYEKIGGSWVALGHAAYFPYTSGAFAGLDSLVLVSEREDETQPFSPAERRFFRYTPLPGGRRQDSILYEAFEEGQWTSSGIFLVWRRAGGGEAAVDSQKAFVLDSLGNWALFFAQNNTYDSQNRLDSTRIRVNLGFLFPFPSGVSVEFIQLSKRFYDAQSRLERQRDTAYVEVYFNGMLVQTSPALSGILYRFYSGPTTQSPAYDSTYQVLYGEENEPPDTLIGRILYTYDANGNLLQKVEEECDLSVGGCSPRTRERYAYSQYTTALSAQVSPASLTVNPLRAGETLFLRGGREYALYSADGRLISAGSIPPEGFHLLLPVQTGIYLLRVDARYQRLVVVSY
ncbi:MAG: hypothetical protein RMK19_05250 [Bacteroidia bacterium]|nr:hypothetical protein [Bacteroidia bacterium]MDW8015399.1 hypothetical protein [Bacteroidia bacterium]